MSADRLEQLFQEAADLPPAGRAAFLDERCAGDPELRGRVEGLLQALDRADSSIVWDRPAIEHEARHFAAGAEPGHSLDRYRLLERLGAGGMGVVYKAVRTDDVHARFVAIKIAHGEAADTALLERLRSERRILASLDHPNIARFLDGGASADGLPFLVMEHVDGERVDQYVARRALPERQILELFRKICAAVSCAHRNLVVHRDLKPSNILVTAGGEPKVLDFGVSKLLDGSASATSTRLLTPEYASPEQLRGEPIGTSSDVYSLGILLCQLLGGDPPFRDPGSLKLTRAAGLEPELRNILQMALRAEPARRYSSAEQFSDDIRRYLDGYPILARPDTRRYRLRKFVGRNRAGVAAAAAIVLALGGGIAATSRQARIAERRFRDVRRLANSYLFEVHDAIQNLPGATPARQLVVKRALEYLDGLSAERPRDPALIRELASAYMKIGTIQGMPNVPSLGDRQGALENFRKALALRQRVAAEDPRNPDIALEIEESHEYLAAVLVSSGDIQGAAGELRAGLTIAESLAAAHPGMVRIERTLALACASLGDVLGNPNLPNLGDSAGALAMHRRALAITEKLAAADPGSQEARDNLFVRHFKLGQIEQSLADGQATVESFQKAIAINAGLLEQFPENTSYRRSAALANRSLALAYVQLLKDYDRARPYSGHAVELFEQLAESDPKNVEAQIALADAYYGAGYILPKEQAAERVRWYDRSIALYETILREHSGVSPAESRTAYQLRSDSLIELGRFEEALADIRRVLGIDERLLEINPQNASARRNQGLMFGNLGKVHERKSEWRDARRWYGQQHDLFAGMDQAGTLSPMYHEWLNRSAESMARCDRALAAVPTTHMRGDH
jgi:tetratricopeptide (TPR) repeat protein